MSDYTQPIGYIDRIAAWFGVRDLDFRLSRTDRRRLLYASGLPLLVLVGDATLLYLQAFQDRPFPGVSSSTVLGSGFDRPEFWDRLYLFTTGVQTSLLLAAVALLFIYSVSSVPRPQASWAFLVALTFVPLTVFFGLLGTVPSLLSDDAFRDWYIQVWQGAAFHFGFLAIGYAFLAFRDLSVRQLPRGRRVRIPPSQLREL